MKNILWSKWIGLTILAVFVGSLFYYYPPVSPGAWCRESGGLWVNAHNNAHCVFLEQQHDERRPEVKN